MRASILMMVAAVIAFIASSVLFCVGIGLSIEHEGWGNNERGLAGSNFTLLSISAVLMSIAIVMFWIGMHRLSNPTR